MQKLAILALVLALAAANTHARFADPQTVLAQIDADPFGNIILSAVQAHIQAQTPANEINMLLNAIGAGLNQDQNDHDKVNRTDQAGCDRILADLDRTNKYHENQIESNTKLRDDTTEALATSESDIRQTIKDIESNENTYASEDATRTHQHDVWVGKDAAIDEVVDAIDEAAKLIQHLSLGASFAQVKTKYEVLHKKLSDNQSHTALLQPIIAALTELATHGVNQKALTKIAQLLSEIRQNLVSEKGTLRDVEERQAEHWAEFSAHLTAEHSRLVERKSQLEVTIQEQNDTIADSIEWIEFHTIELEISVESLASQEEWCNNQSDIYANQSSERAHQQEVIDRLQEHISEKLSATAQYVAKR